MREPSCRHAPTCRISSHEDLEAAAKTDDAMASMHCCDRDECQEKIKFWVQGMTGRAAVVVPLTRRMPTGVS